MVVAPVDFDGVLSLLQICFFSFQAVKQMEDETGLLSSRVHGFVFRREDHFSGKKHVWTSPRELSRVDAVFLLLLFLFWGVGVGAWVLSGGHSKPVKGALFEATPHARC